MKPKVCLSCNQPYTTYQTRSSRNGSSKLPLLLKCGHTFCESCLSSKITKKRGPQSQHIVCPICKSCTPLPNGIKDLHVNVYLLGQLGVGEMSKLDLNLGEFVPDVSSQRHARKAGSELFVRKCKLCDNANASCKCLKCDSIMCSDCFEKFHRVSAAIRDHQSVPLLAAKGGTQSASPNCEEHGRLIEYFCTDDHAAICSRCYIIGNHKNHSIISFEEKNKELITDIEIETESAQRVIRQLEKSDEKLALLVPEFKQEIKEVIDAMAESFLHLHTMLQVREMEIIDSLMENFKNLKTALEEKRESFCLNRMDLETVVRDAKMLIENNALVIDSADLLENLRAAKAMPCLVMKKTQAEKEVPFQWDETCKAELVKSMQSFGTILENALDNVDFLSLENAPSGFEFEFDNQDNEDRVSVTSSLSTSGREKANQISSTISSSDGVIIEHSDADSDVTRPSKHKIVSSSDSSKELFQETLTLPVPKGRAQKASVTHICSPNDFLVQLSSNKRKLETLAHNINIWCRREASSKHIPNKVEVGSFVLAKYSVDKTWYRAKVLGLVEDRAGNSQKVHVQYIDYGNEEEVSRKDLRTMEKRFMFYPIFTVRCSLKDVAPYDELKPWSQEAVTEFQRITENQVLLLSTFAEQNKMYEVDLVYIPNEDVLDDSYVSVRDTLVFLELARFKTHSDAAKHLPDPPSYKKVDFIKPTSLKSGDTVDVFVSAVESPSKFHIVGHGDEHVYYLNMHEEMQEMYCNDKNIYSLHCPRLNTICSVLSKDGLWYRGKVISSPKQRQVTVYLVDVGCTLVVGCDRMKKLHSKFVKLPAQAIPCSLADISPLADGKVKWSAEAKHWCKSNMKAASGIARVKKWGEPAEVVIWLGSKVSALTNQSINFLMVENGFAISTGLSSVGATQHSLYESGGYSTPSSKRGSRGQSAGGKYGRAARHPTSPTPSSDQKDAATLNRIASSPDTPNVSPPHKGQRSTHRKNLEPVSVYDSKSTKRKTKESPKKTKAQLQTARPPAETEQAIREKERVQQDIQRALSNDGSCDGDFNSIFIEVIISSYESPADFVLRVKDKEAKLETLMKDMQAEYKDSTTSLDAKWKVGQFCAAKRPIDNFWYRGKILECDTDYLIEMVDYGYKEVIDGADIRMLARPLGAFMECAAVRCHIANLLPAGSVDPTKWSKTAIEFMKTETKDRKLFIKQEGDINDLGLPIDIIVETEIAETAFDPAIRTYHSLRQTILDKGLAMPTKRSSQPSTPDVNACEPFQRVIFEKQSELSQTTSEAINTPTKEDAYIPEEMVPNASEHTHAKPTPSAQEVEEQSSEEYVESFEQVQSQPLVLPDYPSLPINEPIEVFPTYIDMNGVIYVQPKEWEDNVIHLDYELQRIYSSISIVPRKEWQVEQACVAYYAADDRWYRAVVKELVDDEIKVHYIDYGNSEIVKPSCMREMLPEFGKVHPLALYCELYDIVPSTLDKTWSVPVLEYMHELMVNVWCQMKIFKMEENSCLQVELIKTNGMDLGCHLVEQGMASRNSDLAPDFERSALITQVLAAHNPFPIQELEGCGENFHATLTHVELPNLIYLQKVRVAEPEELDFVQSGEVAKINGMVDEFEIMTKKLNSCKSMPLSQLPGVGFMCAAKYSYDDVWYRAIVIESYKTKGASLIFYVDFGTSEVVLMNRLRLLPSEFWGLPAQAIRVYFNIVPPSGPKGFWRRESLNGVIHALACKELIVKITQTDPLTAELFTAGEEGEMHLAYESVIEAGLALLPESLESFEAKDSDEDVVVEGTEFGQEVIAEQKDAEKGDYQQELLECSTRTGVDWWGPDTEDNERLNQPENMAAFEETEAVACTEGDEELSSSDWTTDDEEEEEKDSDATVVKEDTSH
ncbi:RING finger protein 17 [Elysia marginata]|uniref:RING finger protein 17 n=1 Tax=Elysia marginata TaxID=1093978 RepID=A0AAV4J581_9GAST|nr:RING finger protein 17 [Elysia marginata]